jgi:phage-related protein
MPHEVVLLDPAKDFVRALERKLQAKALRAIDLLRLFGPQLPMPHTRKLSGYDLWELRAKQGSTICRLFYFQHQNRFFVVTSGYVKKADRTAPEQIQRALRLKMEYLEGTIP